MIKIELFARKILCFWCKHPARFVHGGKMKNFSEWVKTASGTELLKYKTATEEEKRIISDELDRRLEKKRPCYSG